MNAADEIRRLTQQDTSEAEADAQCYVKTLSYVRPPYAHKNADFMSRQDLEALEQGSELAGRLPDFTRKQVEATEDEIKDAQNWAQTLPDY